MVIRQCVASRGSPYQIKHDVEQRLVTLVEGRSARPGASRHAVRGMRAILKPRTRQFAAFWREKARQPISTNYL